MMEEESYTLFKYVTGRDYSQHTAVESVEIKVHREADLRDMMLAFKSFLLATGYNKEALDEYIEDE